VGLDVALDDGEPQSRAAVLARRRRVCLEERLEHLALQLGGNADAVVVTEIWKYPAFPKGPESDGDRFRRAGLHRDVPPRRVNFTELESRFTTALADLVGVHGDSLHLGERLEVSWRFFLKLCGQAPTPMALWTISSRCGGRCAPAAPRGSMRERSRMLEMSRQQRLALSRMS